MSNWKHAYGWSGHILVSLDQSDGDARENVVAIPQGVFDRLKHAHNNLTLDERVHIEPLGVTGSAALYLACGTSFSEGFSHYGTVFVEAEARSEPGPNAIDHDAEYLRAMKEVYGLDLPPCRLMVGCSSEH